VALAGAIARPAAADPQASLGLTLGGAFDSVVGPPPQSAAPGPAQNGNPSGVPSSGTVLHLGARADVLLLRARERDMAVGPYLDVATAGFHDVDAGGGGEWLLPLTEDFSVLGAGGGFLRSGAGRDWAPGAEGTLFFGSRSYNFHSWYGLAVGAFVQSRWVPATPATLDIVAGVQLDVALLAMPFLYVYTAATH
jgi:hypothetical protein